MNRLVRLCSIFALLVAFAGLALAQEPTPPPKSGPTIKAPTDKKSADNQANPQGTGNQPAAPQFDGKKFYKDAFDKALKNHYKLAKGNTQVPANFRDDWIAEWEGKYDNTKELDTKDGAVDAVTAMLKSLGSLYDRLLDEDETKAFKEEADPKMQGIGVAVKVQGIEEVRNKLPKTATAKEVKKALKAVKMSDDNPLTIERVLEGTPSDGQLKPGDRIRKVDDESVDGKTLDEIIKLIRGRVGTDVKITVQRKMDDDGKFSIKTYTLTRQTIIPVVVKYKLLENGLGYITIESFNSSHCAKQMAEAVDKAKKDKVKSLIVDVRDNPGGSLAQVLAICQFFLKEGSLIEFSSRKDDGLLIEKFYLTPTDTVGEQVGQAKKLLPRMAPLVPPDMPVVILTNENSASASELFAGALQFNKRATVIGKSTFGKGMVNRHLDLPDGFSMMVTIAEYFPASQKVEGVGILPDEEVERPSWVKDDLQLKRAQEVALEQVRRKEAREQRLEEIRKAKEQERAKLLSQP